MKSLLVLFAFVAASLAQNPDCAVLLPASPLSAAGLATPLKFTALNIANGPCNQANTAAQTAFAQGVIYDTSTHTFSVYNPLIIDNGTHPAVVPVAPTTITTTSIIGIWFGANSNTLTLLDGGLGGFNAGACVNGLVVNGQTSVFGQFSYCNAQNWFPVAETDMSNGLFTPPALGTAMDGLPCPTTRDYFIVDQDPQDNVVTVYLVVVNTGQTAQNTSANIAKLGAGNVVFAINPSDEALYTLVDAAIGCQPWVVPDLADAGHMVASLATNELFASYWQGRVAGMSPIALVSDGDPMARVGVQVSIPKVNLYRAGVGEPSAITSNDASVITFCQGMYQYQPIRMLKNLNALLSAPSPVPTMATNLMGFYANRFVQAFGLANLGCTSLLGVPMPMNLTTNGQGLFTGALILPPVAAPSTAKTAAASSLQVSSLLVVGLALFAMVRRN